MMGLAIPRPAMRQGEERHTRARLHRHVELTAEFQAQGMSREEASKKAFRIIIGKEVYDLMAQELERLLNEFLDGMHEKPAKALKEFLWDNKVGILRALQAAAIEAASKAYR